MTELPSREDRLAALLELPPGARQPEEAELAALLAVAERISDGWSAIEAEAGATDRVYETATRLAAGRRRGLPRLPRLAWAGWAVRAGAVAALIAGVFVAVNVLQEAPGPSTRDILAHAEAAISAQGRIVHIVGTSDTRTVFNGTPFTTRSSTETWTYEREDRRTRSIIRDESGKSLGETVLDSRRIQSYDPATDTITITPLRGVERERRRARQAAGGADPLAILRATLGGGKVELAGTVKRDGRSAYVLTGAVAGAGEGNSLTYTIDAKTFLPVELKQVFRTESGESVSVTTSTYRVRAFELLEPTKRNLRLVELAPHPGAKVVRESPVTVGPPAGSPGR